MRPTFELPLTSAPDEVLAALRAVMDGDRRGIGGVVFRRTAVLWLTRERRRFYSPCLHVQFRTTEGGEPTLLGRFSPRHFTSTVTTQGCGSFTYSGQPIQTVTVRAMDGATVPAPTPNYVGAFARTVTLSDASGTATGTFTAHTASPGAFAGGVATLSPVFTFAVARTAPASLVLRATDGEVSSAGYAEGSASVRSGRLHIPNMHGSELLPLPVPLVAQYWNGSAYTTNTLDNCTVVPASAIAMGNYQKSLAACDTRLTPAGNLSFAGGVPSGAGLSLTKPGLGKAGSVDLSLNTGSVPSGLTCVGASASAATGAGLTWFGTPATARATFGIFKSPLIYGRENY